MLLPVPAVASGMAAAVRHGAFRALGFARRLRCGCGRGALVASFPRVRVQSHAACFIALGAVACSVLLCLRRSGARQVLPAVAGRLGLASVLLFCVAGPRSWAGFPSWSVPLGVSCCCLRCYTYSHHCVSL